MKITIVKDINELSKVLATEFLCDISKPNATIALPGGSTPLGMYKLVSPIVKDNPSYKTVSYCNLDEAVSKDGKIKMINEFLNHQYYIPNNIPSTQRYDLNLDNSEEFEKFLDSRGGLDAIYLGVGKDGHIAGITPGTPFYKTTSIIEMTPHFRELVNNSFGELDNIPDRLVTAGPKTLMKAKKITVILSGESKADIVKQAFFGKVTETVPASILQLHPNVTLLLDKAAAQKIS